MRVLAVVLGLSVLAGGAGARGVQDAPSQDAPKTPAKATPYDKPPIVLKKVEAQYSEAALQAKVTGHVQVRLIVDTKGNPSQVRVVRGLGMGLDEKALEAVRQYKFKPAMKDGQPVECELWIDVDFTRF